MPQPKSRTGLEAAAPVVRELRIDHDPAVSDVVNGDRLRLAVEALVAVEPAIGSVLAPPAAQRKR